MKLITGCAEETIDFGRRLARLLGPGDILGLIGELGSGKTTLIKGIAEGLRVRPEAVSSPTFVLIKEYQGRIPLFHLDLYRLDKIKDIASLGVEEYLFDKGVCVIEWAQKLKMLIPDYLEIDLTVKGEDTRELKLIAHCKRYEAFLKTLST